jgi:peptidase S46-like protein
MKFIPNKFTAALSATFLTSLIVVASGVLTPRPLAADEGEWLPEQLKLLDWADLKARGLELSADEIWDGEKGLLSAVVNLNGCSASFVSDEGLVVTNHHCGFSAINRASTVERNYLRDGFVSTSYDEEIPSPGMSVSFVTGYDDVTSEMHAAADQAGDDPAERYQAVQKRRGELAAETTGEFTESIVVPYFEGRIWRRIHRTVLRDVRLVYAPPRAVGEYGGETDNWMWPRHTGDFSFFRAYVSPDGKPAAYAPENVAYQPPRHLLVSEQGAKENSLVMVLGYPGRTNRYLSSIAVAARQQIYYPARLELFDTVIAYMEVQAGQSAEAALRMASRIKSFANVEKNARGMIYGLARNKVVDRKEREEAEFQQWVDGDSKRHKRYGDLLSELFALDQAEADRMASDFVLDGLARFSGSFRQARNLAQQNSEGGDPALAKPAAAEVDSATDTTDSGADTTDSDRAEEEGRPLSLLARHDPARDLLLNMASELPEGQRLAAFDAWQAKGSGDLVLLARALAPDFQTQRTFRTRQSGLRMSVGTLWIEAQEKWRGQQFYPDANSTLRVSTATVKGYKPRDGVFHTPHTTVAGMLAKHTGAGDFDAPQAIFDAVEQNGQAQSIPVCFLADGDTTGGNSGSPVVNGQGHLVGLNFDRVFENVAGDFGWNAERSRNISVDIRYVLWLMREVWPAPRLLDEMGVATASVAAANAGHLRNYPTVEFRLVLEESDPGYHRAEVKELDGEKMHLGPTFSYEVTQASRSLDHSGGPAVYIELLDKKGIEAWTRKIKGKRMAVFVAGEFYSAPTVLMPLPGAAVITRGRKSMTEKKVAELVDRLNKK